MLNDLICEDQILHLLLRYALLGLLHSLRINASDLHIALLHSHTIQHRTAGHFGSLDSLQIEQDTILLALQDLQCLLLKRGSHQHLAEERVDLLGSSHVDLAVADQHATKCRNGVASQGSLVSLAERRTGSHATSVVVLQDCKGRLTRPELADQTHCGVDIQKVVVRDILTVQLGEHILDLAIESGLLMGVLAIAQRHRTVVGHTHSVDLLRAVEVVENCAVVVRADAECQSCKATTLLDGGRAILLLQQREQLAILLNRGNDHGVLEVLCRSTNQRNTADVDLLDDSLLLGTACNGLLEGIEIDDHQINFGDSILCHLLAVALVVAATQDAAEYAGVQSLNTTTQDRGVTRQILNGGSLQTERLDKSERTARRIQFNAASSKCLNYFVQSVFVEDRDQCTFNLFHDFITFFIDYSIIPRKGRKKSANYCHSSRNFF